MSRQSFDDSKIEDAMLALLSVFEFDNGRVWKRYDFTMMEALFNKGFITNPRGRTESIYLTPEGKERGKALAEKLFKKD